MHILVIGGSGFIGFKICIELIRQGHQVKVLAKEHNQNSFDKTQEIEFVNADLYSIPDSDYLDILRGTEAVVFAAGVDDRVVPKKPAWDFFYRGNVETSVRLIKLAHSLNIQNFVFIASYFTHFARLWPELDLVNKHPYIRSRMQQQEQVMQELSEDSHCTFLELPFVFGEVDGGVTLWKPLINYLGSAWPIIAPPGGTSMVSVATVALMVVDALETGIGHSVVPVGQRNMSWKELFQRLSDERGTPRKVSYLPRVFLTIAMAIWHFFHWIRGKESGLNFNRLTRFLTRKLYIQSPMEDLLIDQEQSLSEAFQGTIASSGRKIVTK